MSTVYLGPEGAETLLPSVQWIGTPPSWPISVDKQIQKAIMADGSARRAFFLTKRRWGIGWGWLSKANLDIINNIYLLNQVLHFQNNFVDATWYDVITLSLSYDPQRVGFRQCGRYSLELTLEEA